MIDFIRDAMNGEFEFFYVDEYDEEDDELEESDEDEDEYEDEDFYDEES